MACWEVNDEDDRTEEGEFKIELEVEDEKGWGSSQKVSSPCCWREIGESCGENGRDEDEREGIDGVGCCWGVMVGIIDRKLCDAGTGAGLRSSWEESVEEEGCEVYDVVEGFRKNSMTFLLSLLWRYCWK